MNDHTFLALDFGTKKIGLAVGQLVTKTATALPIIRYANRFQLWEKLTTVIGSWHPCGLVVGLPYRLDGSFSTITHLVELFCNELSKQYQLPIYRTDESLTTLTVRNYFRNRYPHKQLKDLDSYAACLILEGWLNQNVVDNF